jgi:superfamily II DNA or RNA helicase
LHAWISNGQRGVVAVVTGAGKTVFAEACLQSVFNMGSGAPQAAFIVVPTIALLDQWYVSLVEEANVGAKDIATFSGEAKSDQPALINLFVVNTARSAVPQLKERALRSILIVDECHRIASPANAVVLQTPFQATLGLSATPERDYDELFDEVVAPNLGPIIYRYDYSDARADGVIVPFQLINVKFALSAREEAEYTRYTRRISSLMRKRDRGEEDQARLERLLRERAAISNRSPMRVPIAVRLVERHPQSRLIVFHEQIAAANEIVDLLRKRGRRAAAYHSQLGAELRRDNLRQFRRGMIDVLVTCRALDEGVNVPDAGVAVIASATASTRQRIQRLGRVLRPAAGKHAASVYTLFATEVEQSRLENEAASLGDEVSASWMMAEVRNG